MRDQSVTDVDRRLAELASRQHGVVSRAQLLGLGLSPAGIARRVEKSRLIPTLRAVYAVGHVSRSARGAWWTAVLACGGVGLAVLSHRAAAALWELLPVPAGLVDVVVLGRRAPSGVRAHRSRTLRAADVTVVDGLPVTTPSRTLADLAGVVGDQTLRRALHRAEVLRLLDVRELEGARSRALRAALADLRTTGPEITRSELEERMLALIAAHALPRPLVNSRVEGFEVDFLWPAARLVVETDGAETHLTQPAFEADRRRDARLLLAGYRVVRFTWRQVVEEPGVVAATIAALLAQPKNGPA